MTRSANFGMCVLLVVALVAGSCASGVSSTNGEVSARGGFFPDLYDPTDAGEELPDDYRQALPRDAINPVYEPSFIAASGVDWPDDELVIGVDLNGEQRAYPVGFLTFREIVIDIHRGIPTMVTW